MIEGQRTEEVLKDGKGRLGDGTRGTVGNLLPPERKEKVGSYTTRKRDVTNRSGEWIDEDRTRTQGVPDRILSLNPHPKTIPLRVLSSLPRPPVLPSTVSLYSHGTTPVVISFTGRSYSCLTGTPQTDVPLSDLVHR